MDIGDQVYIAEALHEERPVVTVVGAVLKPGARRWAQKQLAKTLAVTAAKKDSAGA